MTQPTIQELQDRHDVGQVMIRYATSIDQGDLDRFATCFTATVEVTGFTPEPIRGRDAFLAWARGALDRFGATHHQITNQEVVLDGDRAHLRSHVQATHELAGRPDTLLILWAIYDDRLERVDGEWRITHHRLERRIDSRTIATGRP